MNIDEAKQRLDRIVRDEHSHPVGCHEACQYTAAFKLALLVVIDYVATLEAENRNLKAGRAGSKEAS